MSQRCNLWNLCKERRREPRKETPFWSPLDDVIPPFLSKCETPTQTLSAGCCWKVHNFRTQGGHKKTNLQPTVLRNNNYFFYRKVAIFPGLPFENSELNFLTVPVSRKREEIAGRAFSMQKVGAHGETAPLSLQQQQQQCHYCNSSKQ